MNVASSVEGQPAPAKAPRQEKGGWTLWLWVVAGFLLLVLAWTVLFSVAHAVKVGTVPTAAQEAKP